MWNDRFSLEQMRLNARITPTGAGSWMGRSLFHITLFAIAFAVTCTAIGMRGILRLGGMVASGGPYAIEHPAPSWAWVLPAAIVLGMVCFFLNLFTSDPDGVNLVPLAWPGVFLSGGWNFLEFALRGGDVVWGWLVCGVVFVLMGGLPLLLALKPAREKVRSRLQKGEGVRPYVTQWLLVVAGILAAVQFCGRVMR